MSGPANYPMTIGPETLGAEAVDRIVSFTRSL